MTDFYHYTTTEGKDAIIRSNKIIRMKNGGERDAFFGKGVYGSSLSPEKIKELIALDDWKHDVIFSTSMGRRAEWAFKICIPENELKTPANAKDIRVYPGDLHLDKYEWEQIKVDK